MHLPLLTAPLFPYTSLFRSVTSRRGTDCRGSDRRRTAPFRGAAPARSAHHAEERRVRCRWAFPRSEEHTSELQSPCNLVCRLLLEKKNTQKTTKRHTLDATD